MYRLCRRRPGRPTPADWIALLGVDLDQSMRVGFAVYR